MRFRSSDATRSLLMGRPPQRPGWPTLTLENQRALLALSMVRGVGWSRIRTLVDELLTPVNVMASSRSELAAVNGIGLQTAAAIAGFGEYDAVDRQLERASRLDAEMITLWDPAYPPLLAELYDAPAFLWVRGKLPDPERMRMSIAVVGTRRPSEYGKRNAHDFARELAGAGFVIVSGLAYGVDAIAHRATLEVGGCTIAVLGSGVDRVYPGSHLQLANQVMKDGALVSEFALGAAPDAPNFPRRNRIVSGLARGTLIVEAYEDGGALITARLAVEQNREVFAVPGAIHSKSSAGANLLIRDSQAKLVTSVADILVEFGLESRSERRSIDVAALEPAEQLLCASLGESPEHIDRICDATGLDPSTALVHLLSLEFKGVVRQLAGKQFYLAYPIQNAQGA
ncbi:MAG: DNA-processing protein DprA [Rhodothermales bacterium]